MIRCVYCRQGTGVSGGADDVAADAFQLCAEHSIMVLSTLRERLSATLVGRERAAAAPVS